MALPTKIPHLMTLADLSGPQITRILNHALRLKRRSLPWLKPQTGGVNRQKMRLPSQSLFGKSIALLFSKRSTRTRLAAETSVEILGGNTIFLGRDDIQLGVNETPRDTARVIGGMCEGIFARVGDHEEIEVGFFFLFFQKKKDNGTCDQFYLFISIGTSKVLACASDKCSFIIVAPDPNPSRFAYTA